MVCNSSVPFHSSGASPKRTGTGTGRETAMTGGMASGDNGQLDVVVVGASFAGLYLLHRLRRLCLSARLLESADDICSTWFWKRSPGARCDIESIDYS